MKLKSTSEFHDFLAHNEGVLAYFSHDECNVCKVLKPKIIELIDEHYPKIKFIYINIKETPEISSQQSIFTVPTIITYMEGKEFIRKSRNIGIEELKKAMERPYNLLFS